MKNVFLLVFVFISLNASAQKPEKEILFKSNLAGKIVMMTSITRDKNSAEPEMHLINRDDRHSGIYYSLTIYTGAPSELLNFLTEIEKFGDENTPEAQTKIHNRVVRYEKMLGYKAISVYEENGLGYHAYRKKDIVKLRKWLVDWIEDNSETFKL